MAESSDVAWMPLSVSSGPQLSGKAMLAIGASLGKTSVFMAAKDAAGYSMAARAAAAIIFFTGVILRKTVL